MNIQLRERPEGASSVVAKTAIADCDIHPARATKTELYPFLAKRWHDHLETYQEHPYQGMMEGPPYPKAQPNASRRDAYPPEGGPQGSSLSFMQKQHLDPEQRRARRAQSAADRAGPAQPRSGGRDLLGDQRLADREMDQQGLAAEGLDRGRQRGRPDGGRGNPQARRRSRISCRCCCLSRNVEPLGQRRYWPIYEAAEEAGLPIGVHAFGFGGNPITASGWPSYYIEEMVGHSQCQQTALASLVLEGVFERYPKLNMVMVEAGFGWAPSLAWRLDRNWERLRSEVPHVKRPPSEYIREHIWWTTQPMEDPERRDHLFDVIDWIGWDKLLFATDYPHWDYDDPSRVLPPGVSDANREAFYLGNAKKVYGVA